MRFVYNKLTILFIFLFMGCAGSVRYQWKIEQQLKECQERRTYLLLELNESWITNCNLVTKCDSLEQMNCDLKWMIDSLKYVIEQKELPYKITIKENKIYRRRRKDF